MQMIYLISIVLLWMAMIRRIERKNQLPKARGTMSSFEKIPMVLLAAYLLEENNGQN